MDPHSRGRRSRPEAIFVCTREAGLSGRPGDKNMLGHTEAGLCRRPCCKQLEKPDNAGGPLPGSTYTWKPVYAGGLAVCTWEAQQSGRPGDKNTL